MVIQEPHYQLGARTEAVVEVVMESHAVAEVEPCVVVEVSVGQHYNQLRAKVEAMVELMSGGDCNSPSLLLGKRAPRSV